MDPIYLAILIGIIGFCVGYALAYTMMSNKAVELEEAIAHNDTIKQKKIDSLLGENESLLEQRANNTRVLDSVRLVCREQEQELKHQKASFDQIAREQAERESKLMNALHDLRKVKTLCKALQGKVKLHGTEHTYRELFEALHEHHQGLAMTKLEKRKAEALEEVQA